MLVLYASAAGVIAGIAFASLPYHTAPPYEAPVLRLTIEGELIAHDERTRIITIRADGLLRDVVRARYAPGAILFSNTFVREDGAIEQQFLTRYDGGLQLGTRVALVNPRITPYEIEADSVLISTLADH